MTLLGTTIDWICVILFILGFIGNLLGLIVFSSRRFRCCSTYTILALASFSINFVCIIRYTLVIHSTTRRWLSEIVTIHWLTCKIFRLSSSFRVLAAWVTVFWVIERFVYVTSRLHLLFNRREKFRFWEKYKFFFMILVALVMITIVTGPTVIFFSTNSVNFNTTHTSVQCNFDHEHVSRVWQHYFQDLSFGFNYHTIRSLLSELIPSLLVALFNIAIVACIRRTTAHVRRRQQYNDTTQLSTSIGTGSIVKLPSHSHDRNHRLHRSLKGSTYSTAGVPSSKMSWMNIVLLLHSLLFFLSSSVTSLVFFSTSDIILAHWVSVIILATCSLNFYIYCLSGSAFRRELNRVAKRYIKHVQKVFVRKDQSHDRPRSPKVTGKPNIYHPAYHTKPQRRCPPPPRVRSYPIHQLIK